MASQAENKFMHADSESFPYTFLRDVDIPLHTYEKGLIRANVFLPKGSGPFPVIATYGPYGKDVPYERFFKKSWDELNPEMKSPHGAWETPDPGFWTKNGYAVVRADERGAGQSPGKLDTMSRGTSEAFFDVVEWCAEQPWSSGKVGLLGISYYAGTQWRVAARQPKGLAAIIPWEGMSDYYRDRVRHGGILSDKFISFWWNNGVIKNQYGRPGRAAVGWGYDTLEGDLSEDVLARNRQDQTVDTANHKFRDEDYYAEKEFKLEDIKVPVLSVANWGGILLHLRGNVVGWLGAGSQHKFLRFIVGRHDLPFYYAHNAELQKSFLDAFLKGDDHAGWTSGKQPKVQLCLRKGDTGFNDAARERGLPERAESDWPLPDTRYERFYLTSEKTLQKQPAASAGSISYDALQGHPIQFRFVAPETTEITGHPTARLRISCSRLPGATKAPSDIDVFVTLRHLNTDGAEIFYTGTMGDPVPVVKGWLRASLRKTDPSHPSHREWLPHRNYYAKDVQPVEEGVEYDLDVEIWPTNVVLEKGDTLVFEVAGHDTQGCGTFQHSHPVDRSEDVFAGLNTISVGGETSWLTLPIIPPR
ncbi:hypothetical protein DIS24_g9271 [Lasiodiplodia hormozganensis]|uniref:Xaa-Pro dipeptidyl-peptidase C-terminal domain-containing protein n=1 Tax=Lasiodiplodia hormozganensis TaxID=869390 RepID=A0AA40CKM4_9PEZI|nr:hypothetical protein DIS24_g9271 [Lasiodiplodia hormozganensis]